MAASLSSRSRLRRAMLFLLVVWSIGGSFLILQASFQKTFFGAASLFGVSPGLHPQSSEARSNCRAVVAALPIVASQTLSEAQSQFLAWTLGFRFGFLRYYIESHPLDDNQSTANLAFMHQVSETLAIPDVAYPKSQHKALELNDFADSLEEDPQCIAAALEIRYSAQHANLYKFGAATGTVTMYRVSIPNTDDLLAPQIRSYGSAAGIPNNLWEPLLKHADRTQIQSQIAEIESFIKGR